MIGQNRPVPAADSSLVERYDLLVLDLDGVVYVGPRAVPAAADALEGARAAGVALAFVTNNAARTPQAVAAHLQDLGIAAECRDVVTSAQAAVRLVAQRVPAGSAVFVIGGEGLEVALRERSLRPVTAVADLPPEGAAAVVQGYGPQMPWRQVVDGAILVRSGVPWVASNTDLTFPTDRGIGPGNGTLVRLLADYAGVEPVVAGKPESALFEETLDRVGGSRPLVVGDRLDTDIAGAVRLGWDSLLVLTGVTDLSELVAAPIESRPTYIGSDLAALHTPGLEPVAVEGGGAAPAGTEGAAARVDGWCAQVLHGRLVVDGSGSVDAWWRAAATAAWRHLDATGRPPRVDDLRAPQREPQGPEGAS